MSAEIPEAAKPIFEQRFPRNEIGGRELVALLGDPDFTVTTEEVVSENSYIKVGDEPDGLRDLVFSSRIKITHVPTGQELIISRTPEDEDYDHSIFFTKLP